MKIQVLVDHLEHNGKRLEPGAVIDLPDEQARALIALGVARPVESKGAKKGD